MLEPRATQSVEPTKELQAEAYARAWDSLSSLVGEAMRLRSQLQELDQQRQQQAAQNGNGAAPSGGATQFDFPPIPPPNILDRLGKDSAKDRNPSSQNNGPRQYVQSNLSDKFQGLALIAEGVKQIAAKFFTPISKGISFGGKNGKSLAEELTQHNLTSRFVDKVLAFNGYQQPDGRTIAQGSNYRFSRDGNGGISIIDVKGDRGEIFSSKNGFTLNQLTKADLKEFAKASRAISSFQQKQSSSQGIEP